MAELVIPIHDNTDVKKLLDFLNAPDYEEQRTEYVALLDYAEAITKQYNSILTELATLKEKVSGITDKKNPLAVMVESLDNLAAEIGKKLDKMKEDIVSFTKNALDTVKEKGLSALGSVFGFLHVKDGLQAMSKVLSKSVESLNKAVMRVDNLEKHNQEKTAAPIINEEPRTPIEAQTVSLATLLADTRMDFENLSPDELKTVYEKLLAIGMDNDLTANENICLQGLVDDITEMLPNHGEFEPTHQHEAETEQGEEM
jgi:hypothetical protein